MNRGKWNWPTGVCQVPLLGKEWKESSKIWVVRTSGSWFSHSRMSNFPTVKWKVTADSLKTVPPLLQRASLRGPGRAADGGGPTTCVSQRAEGSTRAGYVSQPKDCLQVLLLFPQGGKTEPARVCGPPNNHGASREKSGKSRLFF